MVRFIRRAGPAALGLLFAAALARASAPVYPLSQFKAGLKGKARSVFLGSAIEELLGLDRHVAVPGSVVAIADQTLAGFGLHRLDGPHR